MGGQPSLENRRQRFWARVKVGGPDDCWPWLGKKNERGYGRVMVDGVMTFAHRLAFFLTNGYWPDVVRHDCDNPPCCNPKHLLAGTQVDNVNDREKRQRRQAPKGELHARAKLSAEDVQDIRASTLTTAELARHYSVSWTQIDRIRRGDSWKEVV